MSPILRPCVLSTIVFIALYDTPSFFFMATIPGNL